MVPNVGLFPIFISSDRVIVSMIVVLLFSIV